jgi:hypothetical protein
MYLKASTAVAMIVACLAPRMAIAVVPCIIDVSTAPTPTQLVERAELILHVRATAYCQGADPKCAELPNSILTAAGSVGAPGPASWSSVGLGAKGLVEFEVVAVLKGPKLTESVKVPGTLVERDDFNDVSVPYTFVRPGGRGGNCFAFGYRQGGEYLIFFRPGKATLTPYWAPLAAINEQVRGGEDPWVVWVRRQLAGK